MIIETDTGFLITEHLPQSQPLPHFDLTVNTLKLQDLVEVLQHRFSRYQKHIQQRWPSKFHRVRSVMIMKDGLIEIVRAMPIWCRGLPVVNVSVFGRSLERNLALLICGA